MAFFCFSSFIFSAEDKTDAYINSVIKEYNLKLDSDKPHERLGLEPNADAAKIKKRYRFLKSKLHPLTTNDTKNLRLKKISQAIAEVLNTNQTAFQALKINANDAEASAAREKIKKLKKQAKEFVASLDAKKNKVEHFKRLADLVVNDFQLQALKEIGQNFKNISDDEIIELAKIFGSINDSNSEVLFSIFVKKYSMYVEESRGILRRVKGKVVARNLNYLKAIKNIFVKARNGSAGGYQDKYLQGILKDISIEDFIKYGNIQENTNRLLELMKYINSEQSLEFIKRIHLHQSNDDLFLDRQAWKVSKLSSNADVNSLEEAYRRRLRNEDLALAAIPDDLIDIDLDWVAGDLDNENSLNLFKDWIKQSKINKKSEKFLSAEAKKGFMILMNISRFVEDDELFEKINNWAKFDNKFYETVFENKKFFEKVFKSGPLAPELLGLIADYGLTSANKIIKIIGNPISVRRIINAKKIINHFGLDVLEANPDVLKVVHVEKKLLDLLLENPRLLFDRLLEDKNIRSIFKSSRFKTLNEIGREIVDYLPEELSALKTEENAFAFFGQMFEGYQTSFLRKVGSVFGVCKKYKQVPYNSGSRSKVKHGS